MADEGHKLTDRKIAEMEKRIAQEYAQAEREVKGKLDDYFRRFETKDKKWQQWVENGEKTEEQYKAWRTQQMAQGQRWNELKAQLAEEYNHTNQIARSVIDGYMPEIYAINHNYGLYQIESGGNINTSLTLYNRESVERLMREDPEVLPPPGKAVSKAIAQGKAERWSRQKLQSVMTQGILQGESIPHLATRLATEVGETNRKAAVRNARTMATNAQNAGRYDSYRRAKDIGVDLTIEWAATLDGRTRHDHRMLHGQRREVDEPFEVDGVEILYPAQLKSGDSDIPQQMIWNCRCTLLAWVKGFEGETVKHSEDMGDMTFEEWQEAKPEPQDILTQEQKGEAIRQSYIREYGGHGGTAEAATQEVAEYKKDDDTNNEKTTYETVAEYNNRQSEIDEQIQSESEKYEQLMGEQLFAFGTPQYDEITAQIEELDTRIKDLYEEKKEIVKAREEFLSIKGEDEIRKMIGVIDGKHSISDDLWATNLIQPGNPASTTNCGYCSLAYDARRRGIDCKAPYKVGVNDALVSSWWDGLTLTESPGTGQEAMQEIRDVAQNWGAGARGVVSVDYSQTMGHTFAFEVDDNRKVHFVDPQTGLENADSLFDEAISGTVRYGRTDDKELTKNALFYLEKGGWGEDKYSGL